MMPPSIGRHLLLTPGPTNLPETVQAALSRNSSDISSPDFTAFSRRCIDDLRPLFSPSGAAEVFAYIGNGHGAWEAALVNALTPGDEVLVPGTGHFANNWAEMASALGLHAELTPTDWRRAIDPEAIAQRLRADQERRIKAVLLVHIDTATGIQNDVAAVRHALDAADHPALLLVDAVASLGCCPIAMDDWRADVVVGASQKGLMSPPGLAFVAVGDALLQDQRQRQHQSQRQRQPRGAPRLYWDWQRRDRDEEWYRWFCGTAPTQLVYALRASLDLLFEEGLQQVFARHRRQAAATRAAVKVWGSAGTLALNALDERHAAASVTTIRTADGIDAAAIKKTCYQRFQVSLGGGLSKLAGRAFRIGHMGALNDAALLGGLASVESTLRLCRIDHGRGGVDAAIDVLTDDAQ